MYKSRSPSGRRARYDLLNIHLDLMYNVHVHVQFVNLYVKSTLIVCETTCAYSRTNVVEVAHDHQVQVKNYITEDLELLNSYDTWHGNCGGISVNNMC